MPELGKAGEYYRDALLAVYNGSYEAAQDPEMADSFKATVRRAMMSMDFLEADALQEFAKVDTYVPPVNTDTEIERADLIALQSTPAYIDGFIKDKVDQRLASLPEPETYSREDVDFARYILRGMGITPEPVVSVPTEEATGPADGASIISETNEVPVESEAVNLNTEVDSQDSEVSEPFIDQNQDNLGTPERDHKKHVRVRMYLGDNVIVIDGANEVAIPIAREAKQSSLTPEQDSIVDQMRTLVLAYFVSNPYEQSTPQVWEGLIGNKMPFSGSLWYTHIAPFIKELKADGRQLIIDRKPTPSAKRRYYQLNPAFAPDIEVLDEESGREFFTVFKVETEEGRSTIAGTTGKVGNLLIRSSADNPLSLDRLLASGIFTDKEIDAMTDEHKEYLLSSLVSSLRSSLREVSADHIYKIHRVKDDIIKRSSGRPAFNYWLEKREAVDPVMQSQIDRGYAIAKYIESLSERIEAAGLPGLSSEVSEKLSDLVPHKRAERLAQDFKSARKFLTEEFEKFNDPKMSDELFDNIPTHDHPLSSVIDYMFEIVTSNQQELLLKALHPRHGAVFEHKHTESPDTRQNAMRKMDAQVSPVIREALESMNRAGIFHDDGITSRQVMNVWHGLHSGKINRYVHVPSGGLLSVTDVIHAYLKDQKEFTPYFSRSSDRRRILEIVEREISTYKEVLKEQ